jgi:Flp pilus assembly protein TadD
MSIRFSQAIYGAVDPSERAHLLIASETAIISKGGDGAMREALPLCREALRLKPDYWVAYYNLMGALANLGDEEGAVQVGQQMVRRHISAKT